MRKQSLNLIIIFSLVLVPFISHAQSDNIDTPSDVIHITVTHGSFSSEITTSPTTVDAILNNAGIELEENEYTSLDGSTELTEDTTIAIKEPLAITLTIDGDKKELSSKADTVQSFLSEQNILVTGEDYTKPSGETPLSEGMNIALIRKKTEEKTQTERITFKTENRNDASMNKGESTVLQAGKEGSKEVTYSVVYEDGVEISKKVISETILEDPQNKIVAIGTKEPEPVITENTSGDTRSGVVTFYYGPTNAASHIYPKGSVLNITNTNNGKSITVTIDDYGGFGNRLVDLRKDHFQKLGNLSAGLLPVTVTRIK